MAAKYLTNHYDYWVGTGKAEVVYARAGNDDLFRLSGSDELHGGDGNDSIRGGNQADMLYGDAGHDLLVGENGNDQLWGGKGDDLLNGGDGDDTLWGGDGNDHLIAGKGLDDLHGGNGNDRIGGGIWMDGGAGDDRIGGGMFDADGRSANIEVWGGTGRDTFELYSDDDGKVQTVVVNDFSTEDNSLSWGTTLPDSGVFSSGLQIENGQVTTAYGFEVQQTGHDLFITGGLDGDQLILKGAADWLHLA